MYENVTGSGMEGNTLLQMVMTITIPAEGTGAAPTVPSLHMAVLIPSPDKPILRRDNCNEDHLHRPDAVPISSCLGHEDDTRLFFMLAGSGGVLDDTGKYRALPSILIVAPRESTNLARMLETSLVASTHLIVTLQWDYLPHIVISGNLRKGSHRRAASEGEHLGRNHLLEVVKGVGAHHRIK
jgi:hypothetical protein